MLGITARSGQYVFVNLFGGQVGAAKTYPAVHQLIGRIAARTGIGFTAHMLRHSHATDMEGRGVASDAIFRIWREDGAVRDSSFGSPAARSDRRRETPGQRAVTGAGCTRRHDVASSLVALLDRLLRTTQRQKPINEDRRSHLSLPQAEVFSMVGKPLPTSFRRGVPIEVVARLLTHRSSTTTSQVYVHFGAADICEALTRAGCGTRRRPGEQPGACPRRQATARSRRRGGGPRRRMGLGPLGGQAPWHPRPARARHGALRRDQPAVARDPVKRWSRLRLATGCAFTTIRSGALALTRFSGFLAACHPEADRPSAITRPLLEDYLSWLVTQGYSAATRALSLSMIRVFFEACHRHGWLPGLGANVVHEGLSVEAERPATMPCQC